MPLWHWLRTLARNLARKQRVEDDLNAEIRSYEQMLVDERMRAGADPSMARHEARLELGGAAQIQEEVRDVRLGATLQAMGTELRQSLRGLRRNPGLTTLGIVMLALGMGASTVVFSIFYAALVQPLPFRDSGRVVELTETRQERGINQASFTEANFWDVRAQNHSFEEIGAYHYDEANLTGRGPAEKVTASFVSAGFFRTLGVSPVLGRDFSYDEGRAGSDNRVVILGHRFWKTRFGGDPNILGETLRLNDRACTVVGVLPPGEPWINDQLYVPFAYRANADRGSWEFNVVGRLARGVTAEAARADLQGIAASLDRAYPKDDKGIGFHLEPSSTWVASDNTRRALWVLLGAVTFLLLIACLNIANLLLARGMARQREIAVRTALGAGRARLVRFVMMEALLLSGFGAVVRPGAGVRRSARDSGPGDQRHSAIGRRRSEPVGSRVRGTHRSADGGAVRSRSCIAGAGPPHRRRASRPGPADRKPQPGAPAHGSGHRRSGALISPVGGRGTFDSQLYPIDEREPWIPNRKPPAVFREHAELV